MGPDSAPAARLFTPDGGDQSPAAAVVAVFAEVNPLPGAQAELAVADRYRQTRDK